MNKRIVGGLLATVLASLILIVLGARPGITDIISLEAYDYYPVVFSNVNGMTSSLVLSNDTETTTTYQVCVRASQSPERNCNNVTLEGYQQQILDVSNLGLQNNTGAIEVFAVEENTAGFSKLLIQNATGYFSFVEPLTFNLSPGQQ
ncbi:hypothetical protein [Methylocaldum sp.]|uniref:hypothetical protein n=1 Tax=Methylocaldum sp. TaxID=1969727 RepID=UPI002D61E065|nr:hypothetical protein [Methylocaldum sp.]HYE35967.1 hypothetical protein [Methylocaldum sp.]